MPDLVITTLGEEASLCVTVGATPDPCVSFLLQRDGILTGGVRPINALDSYPVITVPKTEGTYKNGASSSFEIDTGADLVVGDSVEYVNKIVRVTSVTGDVVTIDPPIGLDVAPPGDGTTNMAARTVPYLPATGLGDPLAFPIPIPPGPLFGFPFVFTALDIPVPGFAAVQAGDIVLLGGKTALVVSASITPFIKQMLVVPLGVIPPPMPAGLAWICYRALPNPLDSINNGLGLYKDGDETGFTISGNPALDPKMVAGAYVVYNSTQVRIGSVAPAGSDTRITLETELDAAPTFTSGAYFMLPEGLSQFLAQVSVPATGSYRRLSRLTETTTASGLVQVPETGAETTRSGEISSVGAEARKTLDGMMTRSGYQGLDTLLKKLRGSDDTETDRSFNKFNGMLVKPTGANRFFAVNVLADQGTGSTVHLDSVRALQQKACGSTATVNALKAKLETDGVAVLRLSTESTADPLVPCAPEDLLNTTKTVCRGVASKRSPLLPNETARVFVSAEVGRTAQLSLLTAGLTAAETDAALSSTHVGRVVEVVTVSTLDLSRLTSLSVLTSAQLDEVLGSLRVQRINVGTLNRDQIQLLIRRRGRAGVIQRMPGTDASSEAGAQPIDDLAFPALNLLQSILQFQATLDLCDFDAALAAIPDAGQRAFIGGVFALIDGAFGLLEQGGNALNGFLNDPMFVAITDTIGGLLTAIASDPTLGCLFGPIGTPQFNLPGIPFLDFAMKDAAAPLQVRFQLTQLFAGALNTLVCVLVGQILKLLPADAAAFGQRAIGCLPPISLTDLLNIPIDVEVTLQCSFDKLLIIQDLINAAIEEANEFVSFSNGFTQGFVFRNIAARNTACAGSPELTDIFDAASNQFGIGNLVGQVKLLAATAASAAGGN
jgi:hypothetical protein